MHGAWITCNRALAVLLAWLCTANAPAADVAVRMLVTTPPMQPEPERIYMSTATDDWPEAGRPLKRLAERLYEIRLSLPASSSLAYKFLREPAWKTVEKDARGEELSNRHFKIAPNVSEMVVFNDVARWADQPEPPPRTARMQSGVPQRLDTGQEETTRTGDIRVHPTLLDEKTGVVREVHVYLPPGYSKESKTPYPVLYLLDGQNLFDKESAFIGVEWQVDETLEELIPAGRLPPLIVVGVYNSPERMNEYTPFRDEEHNAGGGADKHLDFILGTIKPFIDRTYHTASDRKHTAIGGSSLGGVFALYAIWKRPEAFSRAAVVSPACGWAREALTDFVRTSKPPENVRLWVDMGTREGPDAAQQKRSLEAVHRLVAALKEKGLSSDASLHYEEAPGAAHNEAAWAARFGQMVQYLFRD